MSFSGEIVERRQLLGSSGGAVGRAADVALAAVAAGAAVFVSSPRELTWSEVVDWQVAARFSVVFVILVMGLVAYHRIVERREATRIGRIATEELSRAKDQFIANVSHGLRTPLTGIVGFAHILESSVTNPAELEAVNTILGESAELGRIVDDLVVAARLDADSLTVQLEDVSFAEQLEPVLQYMDLIGAPVIVDCDEANVRVDPELFRQVLRNLLANAHRHGRPKVMVKGQIRHGRLVCHVVDNGSGVPADLQDKLFTRFPYRHLSGVTGHVGLGLAIVQELCERMGCQVGYRRIRGQTHFLVSVPLASEQPRLEDGSPARIEVRPERLIRVRDRLVRVPA